MKTIALHDLKLNSKNSENTYIVLFLILFAAGFIFHSIKFTKPIIMMMTDAFLLVTNSIVFYFLWKKIGNSGFIIWSTAAFIITFLLEYIGVKTGKVFGGYQYGETMLIQLGNVPIVIGFNWVVLIMATYNISRRIKINPWLAPITGSLLIVVFDYVMEPVAMYLNYWQWENDVVPFQNYLAWFIISLVFSYALTIFKLNPGTKILRYYFFIQLVFFLLFRIEMAIIS